MNPTPEQGAVIRKAAEWHQRLHEGALDRRSRRELRAWLRTPNHIEELARMCLIEALLDGALHNKVRRHLPKNVIDFGTYAGVTRQRPPAQQLPAQQPPAQHPQVRASRFKIKKLAIAASLLFAVIATAWLAVVGTDPVITTASGGWDKQLLEDGSVVYVGPNSKLSFHFTDEVRGVKLVRGRALFEVAKDPNRPLVVSTDAGTVRAVGTAFSTTDLGDTVIVNVAEGKVAVTATAVREGVQPMVHATANQQVVLSPTGVSTPVSIDAEHELMWIRNWYEYEGERVEDIVAELNQLNDAQVVVDDPKVLRLRVNLLSFKPSQPEEFVRLINLWYAGYPGKTTSDALRIERP